MSELNPMSKDIQEARSRTEELILQAEALAVELHDRSAQLREVIAGLAREERG